MGWCDDVNSSKYNKLIKLDKKVKHEKLFRKDYKYDFFIPINYNTKNPKIGDIAVRSSNFNIFRRIKQQHNKYLSKQMYKMTQKNMMYINFPKKKHYIDIVDHP